MNNTYTPPQKKVITSLGLEEGVREWLDENTTNKSYFVNELLKRHIRREAMRQAKNAALTNQREPTAA